MSKPIGVSAYQITSSLLEELERQLPSVEDIQKRIKGVKEYITDNKTCGQSQKRKIPFGIFLFCCLASGKSKLIPPSRRKRRGAIFDKVQ